jgi:hypothetical protein
MASNDAALFFFGASALPEKAQNFLSRGARLQLPSPLNSESFLKPSNSRRKIHGTIVDGFRAEVAVETEKSFLMVL